MATQAAQIAQSTRNLLLLHATVIRLNGTTFEAEASVLPVPYEGAPALQLVLRDLTPLGEISRQLVREKNLLNAMLEAVPVGCMLVEPDGCIEVSNTRFTEITGYTKSDFFTAQEWFFTVYPDESYRNQVFADWQEDMHKPSADREYTILCKDGSKKTIEFHGGYLVDGRYLINMNDVTQERKREMEIRRAKRAAEEADAAKSEFLAIMSHEIRTPMQMIIGMADVLHDTALDNDQRGYVNHLLEAAEHLTRIISDVLDLSRIESKAMELSLHPVNLRELCTRIMELCRTRRESSNLEIVLNVSDALPEMVIGDATRLGQVLLNLMDNAIKFTAKGHVTLSVGSTQGDVIHFTVSDTGKGIPKERQSAVFEPFRQADASTTREHGGSGLGLAICKRLVEMMGGTLRLESAPGEGSAFSFSISMPAKGD